MIWSFVPSDTAFRPASTVVVLKDGTAGLEVLLVRRHQKAAFMAGAHVFPGGVVEAGDHAVVAAGLCDVGTITAPAGMTVDEALAYRVAAVRELFEEAGIFIARDDRGRFLALHEEGTRQRFVEYRHQLHAGSFDLRALLEREQLRLATDVVLPCAHWVTPPVDVRRFDTRFFVAPLPEGQEPVHDARETTESAWMTPASALAASTAGTISLPPPTWITLRELEGCRTVSAAMAWARQRRVPRREPRVVEEDGVRMTLMPGDPLFPDDVEPVVGETRFVLADGRWYPQRVEP